MNHPKAIHQFGLTGLMLLLISSTCSPPRGTPVPRTTQTPISASRTTQTPTSEEFETIGELGYTLGVWEFTRLTGTPQDNPVREVVTKGAITDAAELDIRLHLEELNKADSSDEANRIFERVANDIFNTYGSRAQGLFEVRYFSAVAEFALTSAETESDSIVQTAFVVLAGAMMRDAVNAAEQAGVVERVVSEGRAVTEMIFELAGEEIPAPAQFEEVSSKIFEWERLAIEAVEDVGVTPTPDVAMPPSQGNDAILRIINDSEHTICYVVISAATDYDWDDGWLDDDNILPGETYLLRLPQGDYSVVLLDCDENLLLEEYGVAISDQYELHFTGSDPCEAASQDGVMLYGQALYLEALGRFQDALACYREAGSFVGEGRALNNIGYMYGSIGEYREALSYYKQALSVWQEIGARALESVALSNIGHVCVLLGMYSEALDYTQQAIAIAREMDDLVGEGIALGNIGLTYLYVGQYQQALDYYLQALAIQRETGDRGEEAECLNKIGDIYNRLGQYEEALDYTRQALSIHQEIGNRRGVGTCFHSIGDIYDSLGQYWEALDYYQQALVIKQEIGDRAGESTTLNNIGLTYNKLGFHEEAQGYHQTALTIAQETGDRTQEAAIHNNIGSNYESLGQYDEALDYYQQAMAIARDIGDLVGEGIAIGNIGLAYHRLGQYEEALAYYQQAISLTEVIRGGMTVEEVKSSFFTEKVHVYDFIITLLTQMEHPDEAFDYVQRAKARTFLDQLANVRIDPRVTDSPELLTREQERLGEIRDLEAVLSGRGGFAILSPDDAAHGNPPSLTGEQRSEVRVRLEAAYREYEQLLTQIKLTNPHYASLRSVQASTLITVQQTLPPGATLLEYYVTLGETYVFIVTQDDFHAVSISVTSRALNDSIIWLRQFPSLEGVPQASRELYDLLFAPIREHIHTTALYIAPHSVLHYLPFGALYDGERYVVEDYAIAYLPSASVLQYVRANIPDIAEGDLLALCNPEAEGAPHLNYAIAETEAIATLFDAQPFLGPDATETRLWEQSPHASLVHIAAHGQFNPLAPQFSRISLAPDDENDGYLEVREVFSLRLDQADLVTLSACETQLGELSAGDELVGLSRAFIYAGTPSLVATLWSVDDESTRFLMERFYGYLREGQDKALALRQAQLDTMEEYPSPYYWAPFMLIGDMGEAEAIEASDRTWLWIGGVILLLVVIGGGIWMWSRRK